MLTVIKLLPSILRGDRVDANGKTVYGLRQGGKSDFDFREDDIYNERLYAIKYENQNGQRYYRAPNERDMANEEKVKQIVEDNIKSWQEQGLVPIMAIESGYNTDQVIRERGWSHWYHLFNSRELLINGLLVKNIIKLKDKNTLPAGIIGLNKCLDFNSTLCRWDPSREDSGKQTFIIRPLIL